MNTPHDHPDQTDPLLQSLADEAADLPARAAREARARNLHHMRQRFHVASAVTILFVFVCSWSVITTPERHPEFIAAQPVTLESDPEKPPTPNTLAPAMTEPIAPIAPAAPVLPEALDNPSPSPAPMIASSTPTLSPRPNAKDPRAHPAPTAPVASHPLMPSATLVTDPSGALPREFVKVQTEKEAMRNPLPLPEGLDHEQQELFKAARGLPLLLLRDSAGKVLRIHVIER